MVNRNRTLVATLCLAASALGVPSCVFAEGYIEATLSLPGHRDPQYPARVVLSLRNTGDESVSVMKWDTPFVQSGGRLPKPIFIVSDLTGTPVEYQGTYVNFVQVTMDSYITIEPGQSLEKEIDLTHEYRFGNGGVFEVRYALDLTTRPDPYATTEGERERLRVTSQARAESNTVTISIDGPVAPLAHDRADGGDCDAVQKEQIARAHLRATGPVIAARDFMFNRYKPVLQEDGVYHYVFEPQPRYAHWFGAHDPAESAFGDPGWGEGNTAQVFETLDATVDRILKAGGGALIPRCGCPGFDPATAAHPETSTTYVMHFCDRFFELPIEDPRASQAGVIAHEYTHYNDAFPGRGDYLYGVENAEKLAKENPWKAVRNGDNFEYFIFDKRPYPPSSKSLQVSRP